MRKAAYPSGNGGGDDFIHPPYDTVKWASTFDRVKRLGMESGAGFDEVFSYLTQGWDEPEKRDFKSWISYQEMGMPYKTADQQNQLNIPIEVLKAQMPGRREMDLSKFPAAKMPEINQQEEIDKKIKSIVSRLTAAERMVTDPLIQKVLETRVDMGLKKLLEDLHSVKRRIQLAPMKNVRSSILEDILYKHANVLRIQGFSKTASFFEKIAQAAPSPQDQTPPATPLTPLANPSPIANQEMPDDTDQAIEELIKAMNGDEGDVSDADDSADVIDMGDDPLANLHIIAQEAPAPVPIAPPEAVTPLHADPGENPTPAPVAAQPIDNTIPEEVQDPAKVLQPDDEPDDIVDNDADVFDFAMKDVTVEDIVIELEEMGSIFRTRQLPRRFFKIDLMLDQVGLSSYFPSLGEAASKALESNQYCLTRVEDIISKLRGSTVSAPAASTTVPQLKEDNLEVIKDNLQKQDDLDQMRKDKRKQDEIDEALGKPTAPEAPAPAPVTNVQQDLTQPVNLPK